MFSRFYRLIHRARSRSQRMRMYGWILTGFSLFLLLLLVQQPRTASLRTSLADRGVEESLENSAQRVQDLKRLQTDNKNNGDSKDGSKNSRSRLRYANELGEEEEGEDAGDLLPDLAPPVVHFLWCGADRKFEYRHYLAMRRASEVIKPDKIVFHHRGLPQPDPEGYYTWFNQTLSETANLVLRHLDMGTDFTVDTTHNNSNSVSATPRCPVETGAERYILVLQLLQRFGGVYVPEDAILVDFPVHLRAASFVSGVLARSLSHFSDGIIVARRDGFTAPTSPAGLLVVLASGRASNQGTALQPCGSPRHFDLEEDGDCICVKVGREITPASTWGKGQSNFGTLIRLAGYGSDRVEPRPGVVGAVPRIGHYICWNCEIKFGTYVSVLSSLYVAGLTKVYIHGIKQPSGLWWRHLQETQRVIHVHREFPEHSLDRATMTHELAVGIMRVAILLKYGGVYCDDRVIWTQAIPDYLYSYEAVASPGWRALGSWPDSISHSTILAKKNSEYLLKLRNLHAQNRERRFWFVDQFLSYKIVERHPEVLLLERHLQVTCVNQNCHPTWLSGYKVPFHENPQGPVFNWYHDTLSVLWDVFPSLELDTVKYTSGPIVEVARRVFNKAGVSLQGLTAR